MSNLEVNDFRKALKSFSAEEEANAAVAVLLKLANRKMEILSVKRVENLKDPWFGQIALPGGKREPEDHDLKETVKVPNPVFFDKVKVARAVLKCDVLIGAPTLKTHHLTGITVALKNLYGVIPPDDKTRLDQAT